MQTEHIIDSHVWWGPEGLKLTEDEKELYINTILDQIAAEQADTIPISRKLLKDISKSLDMIMEMSMVNAKDFFEGKISKDVLDLKHAMRSAVGMNHVLLSQDLDFDDEDF